MSPSFMRNPLRAWRYLQEGGVMTLRGDDVTTDLDAFDIFGKAFGFTSVEESLTYEIRSFVGGRQDVVADLKASYLEGIFQARRIGDKAAENKMRRNLMALGSKYPGLIKPNTIERSIRSKQDNMDSSVNGLRVTEFGRREYERLYDGRF